MKCLRQLSGKAWPSPCECGNRCAFPVSRASLRTMVTLLRNSRFLRPSPAALLAVVLLVAFSLRIIGVSQPLVDVFSWRQASTAMIAKNFFRGEWNILFPQVDWTGPGPNYQGREFPIYSYAVALLWKVFGEEEAVGRALSAIAGTWAVFAFFQLVRRVWDEESALWSAAVLAVLPGAVFIDRSFLPDPLMLSLLLTGCWWFLAYLQCPKMSPWHGIAAMAVLAMGFLTKLPAAISLIALVAAAGGILQKRGALRGAGLRRYLLAGVVCLVPILAYYTWALHLGTTYPPYHIAGAGNWLWSDGLGEWLGKAYYLPDLSKHAIYWLWTWPVIGLAVVGMLFLPPRSEWDPAEPSTLRPRWFFHLWLLGGLGLWIFGIKELVYNPWNFHAYNAPVAAFAGLGLARIVSIGRVQGLSWTAHRAGLVRAVVILLGILVIGRIATAGFYQDNARESRELGFALARLAAPDDLVVTIANDVGDPVAIYYSGHRGWVFPPTGKLGHKYWNLVPADPASNIKFFEYLRRRGADWFGIVSDPKDDTPGREKFWQNHKVFVDYLSQKCEMVEKTKDYVIYRIPKG